MLPNKNRNYEVQTELEGARLLDLGPQRTAGLSKANALASLDVAESLQLLHLQLAESTESSNATLHETTDKLIASNEKLAQSNDRHATAMQLLTGALVLTGIIQAVVAWASH